MNKKPTKGEYLEVLLRSPKTIFTNEDIALLWAESAENSVRVRLSKYVKSGKLIRLRRGIYAKDMQYDRLELATRIYTPAYISFETVLTRAGINFQYYGNIFVASYVNRDIVIGDQRITLIRMRDTVLSDVSGINHKVGYSIATKERAFLDRICMSTDYHFDHLDVLDWDTVFEILPIYQSKRMNRKVQEYFEHYKNEQKNI